MKVCKRCGNGMSNDVANDFCTDCSETNAKISRCENAVNTISFLILMLGIICSIVMFLTIIYKIAFHYDVDIDENLAGIAITISTLLSSILLYYLLQIAIGISKNIRCMANK